MAESPEKKTRKIDSLALAVVLIVIIAGLIASLLVLFDPNVVYSLLPGASLSSYIIGGTAYEIIYVVLTTVTDVLYLFGAAVIGFGATLVIIKFGQRKLKDPYQPTASAHSLSGYLTLSLNFFIGAEIVRTVVVGVQEIYLLFLIIASRGVFSLILYLERRWHGTVESE
jgi:uncharacterized membrane protein